MKSVVIISLLGWLSLFAIEPNTGIKVIVSGAVTEEVVMFAEVSLFSEDSLVVQSQTCFDGYAMFSDLSAGLYEVEVKHLGLQTSRKSIVVSSGEVTQLEFRLKEDSALLDYVEVVGYKVPLVEMDNTTSGCVLSEVVAKPSLRSRVKKYFKREKRKELTALPTKNIAGVAATTAGVSVSAKSKANISIRGSRYFGSDHLLDGIRVSPENAAMMIPEAKIIRNCKVFSEVPNKVNEVDLEHDEELVDIEELKQLDDNYVNLDDTESAGQLTAAEWNDLTNWKDWIDLTEDGVYTAMLDYWQLPMGERITVLVTNENNFPLANCKVSLLTESDQTVWEGTSDNSGKVELWQAASLAKGIKLVAGYEDESFDFHLHAGKRAKNDKMDQTIQLPVSCNTATALDIMFVVDATGSMSDEIAYLKAELADVVEQVSSVQEELEIRVGSVFYKDKWDDFLTAETNLSTEVDETVQFMEKQIIGGGADFPEAVEAGLEKALAQDWNPNAINRIIFLLLDAPPHNNPEVLAKLSQQVKTAAARGIKIIPITASGIDRETEYLMKQMAMMTNGTYVFLTDDSGIGEGHLTHAIPDYDVEKLNALLVRLIVGYAEVVSCVGEVEEPVVIVHNETKQISVQLYPNPAIDQLTLELSDAVDQVVISTSTGRRVRQLEGMEKGRNKIGVGEFISGRYNLSLISGGRIMKTLPFLVVS